MGTFRSSDKNKPSVSIYSLPLRRKIHSGRKLLVSVSQSMDYALIMMTLTTVLIIGLFLFIVDK